MPNRSRRHSLWIAAESTYATDPSATGSGYAAVPIEAPISWPTGGRATLETNYAISRNRMTAAQPGADGGSISFKVALRGLLTAAGNGTNASAVAADYLDRLLDSAFGTVRTTVGDDATAATAANITTTDNTFAINDVLAVFATGATTIQWRRTNASTSSSQNP